MGIRTWKDEIAELITAVIADNEGAKIRVLRQRINAAYNRNHYSKKGDYYMQYLRERERQIAEVVNKRNQQKEGNQIPLI